MHRRYLAALLVLSGFCGLAYELIWVRMLSLSFGSTTLSFSTVIAVFLGGLALGSWLCGRSKRALANPVKTYAWLEIATGIIGLALYPVLSALPEAFSYIDPGVGAGGLLARLAVSLVILLPPTLLMGATLPVACAACIHDDTKLGSGTAILYGLNTLGACLGTYGVTFVLFPSVGLSGAVYSAVALNFIVGVAAMALEARRTDIAASPPASSMARSTVEPASVDDASFLPIATSLAFATGFAAIGSQVVWSRMFANILQGSIYGVGSVLVAVLVGIGVGSVLTSRLLTDARHAAIAFVGMQALSVVALVSFWSALPWIQYEIQSLGLGLAGWKLVHFQLVCVIASLAVPAASLGVGLPILVVVVERHAAGVPRALSRLYAVNTVGCVLGSLAAGFVLVPLLGSAATAYAMTLLVVGTTAVAAVRLLRELGATRYVIALGAVTVVGAFPEIDLVRITTPVPAGQSFWAFGRDVALRAKAVRYFEEGTVATVAVTESSHVRSLSLNGLGQGSWSNKAPHHLFESLLVAQIPLIHAPKRDTALVVGLGAGTTVSALVQQGVSHIEVLELEPAVLRGISHVFLDKSPLESPQVQVIIDDARHHLLLNRRSSKRFDVVTSMPAHPWVAANIFTREFFELARDNLTPDGVFSTWFGRGRMTEELFLSLYNAFADAFPHHVVYDVPEAHAFYLVGSPAPIRLDPANFASVVGSAASREQTAPVGDITFFTTRVAATGTGEPAKGRKPINTDGTIFAETLGPLVGGSTVSFGSRLGAAAGLAPSLIPESAREDVLVWTIEATLGTADGYARLDARPGDVARAEALWPRMRPAVSDAARDYIDARLRAERNGDPDALQRLYEIAGSGGAYAERAAAFAVALDRDEARRSQRLTQLVDAGRGRGDLWIRAIGSPSQEQAVSLAATRVEVDARAWLIAAAFASPPPNATLTAPQLRALAPHLASLGLPEATLACSTAAARLPSKALATVCERAEEARLAERSRELVQRALRAGKEADYQEASELFAAAHLLRPLDAGMLDLYFRTAVRAGQEFRIETLRSELQLRGVPDGVIEARILEATTNGPIGER